MARHPAIWGGVPAALSSSPAARYHGSVRAGLARAERRASFLRTAPGDGQPRGLLGHLVRWSAVAGMVAALVGGLIHLHRAPAPGPPVRTLDRARFVAVPGPQPPADGAPGWQATTLPDDWIRGRPGVEEGWYAATFDLAAVPDELWAIHLPTLSMNAAVFLNGRLLGSGGRFEAPVARNWNQSLCIRIPSALLRAGANVVHVRLRAVPAATGLLGRFHVGPDAILRRHHRARVLLRVTAPLVIAVAGAVMGVAMLLVWALRRERVYGWFGLGNLVWAARDLNLFVVDSALPAVFWDWLWILGIGWVILLVVPYVHALLGLERPRVDRAVIAYGLAHSAALTGIALAHPGWLHWYWRHVWDPLLLPVGLYPTILMIRAVGRSTDLAANAILVSGLVVFALAVHDLLLLLGVVPRVRGFLFHYGAAPVVVVFGSVLLLRFVDGLREVEALNRDLERRVAEKTAEIERSYRQLARLEAERARGEERERILSDLHDGVGAQIVATLALLESGQGERRAIAETLGGALDELRLTVDTLGPGAGRDAVTALAMLRRRLQPSVEAAGLRLVWRVADDVPLPRLGDEATLDVLRIVQEAVTNVLRHAGARTVEVSIAAGPGGAGLAVAVTDDGDGVAPGSPDGHGLPSMRRRAERLGAALEVTSSPRGTRVALLLAPAPDGAGER